MTVEEQVERPAAPVRPSPAARGWDVLLVVAIVVQAAALTAWPRVVTVDGPAHLAGAAALLHVGDPSHALYQVHLEALPNVLTTALLAVLLTVLGPDAAERVLVVGYAVGLPLAMRYALRGVHPEAGWLALAAVPFVGGYLYAYGFYNFCLALVGMLVAIGLGLRQQGGWSVRSTVTAALVLVLTWSAHLMPLLVSGLLLAVLGLCRAGAAWHLGRRRALVSHLLPVVLAGLPVLALTVAFVLGAGESRGAPVRTSSVPGLVVGLLALGRPLVAWTSWEYVGSVLVAVALVLFAASAAARRERSTERLAVAVTGLVVTTWYLASPDRYGPAYGFLNDRLSLFPPLLLVLWSAAPPPARRVGRTAVVALLLGAATLLGLRLPTELQYQRDVAEMLSVAPQVPRGSTLVALRLARDAPAGPDARNRARDPLRHQAGRIAVLRDSVDIGHYQAVTNYFPMRFHAGDNPRRAVDPHLDGLELVPPRVDLARGPQVVLLVGRQRAAAGVLQRPETVRLLQQLDSSYRLVDVSERSGLVEVWRRG